MAPRITQGALLALLACSQHTPSGTTPANAFSGPLTHFIQSGEAGLYSCEPDGVFTLCQRDNLGDGGTEELLLKGRHVIRYTRFDLLGGRPGEDALREAWAYWQEQLGGGRACQGPHHGDQYYWANPHYTAHLYTLSELPGLEGRLVFRVWEPDDASADTNVCS